MIKSIIIALAKIDIKLNMLIKIFKSLALLNVKIAIRHLLKNKILKDIKERLVRKINLYIIRVNS